MITLTLPRSDQNKYIWLGDFLYGPYGPNQTAPAETITIPAKDLIWEQKGIYHENHVIHTKWEGTVSYDPIWEDIIPYPSTQYPDRVKVPWGTGTYYQEIRRGVATAAYSTRVVNSTTSQTVATSGFSASGWTNWVIWWTTATPTKVVRVSTDEFKIVGHQANGNPKIEIKTTWYSVVGTWHAPVSMNQELPPSQVNSIFDAVLSSATVTVTKNTAVSVGTLGIVRRVSIVSPYSKAEALMATARLLEARNILPEEKHYGILAQQASQNINRTHINMLSFLKDLKDIKSLIPKLRNLRSIKTWADNYLSIKYGVLPTISDVQSIISAFERLKASVDRNGFKLYYATHTDYATDGDITAERTQRLKLAVGNEDNGLEALLDAFESVGVLPNFENIWDLIPYSFVIDWLIDVGGLLERVDTHLRIMRFNVKYVTMSRKSTSKVLLTPKQNHRMDGSITLVQYHRWVSDQCPVPPLALSSTLESFDHWVEASALLIQRAR